MTAEYSLNTHMRARLIRALSGTPSVVAGLTASVPAGDARWDRHPDPDRFSLREVIAHLSDWDSIYLERLTLMRDRPGSRLKAYDENRLAAMHDYARADPLQSLKKLAQSRGDIVRLLAGLPGGQWEHTGVHPDQGVWTIDIHASYVLMHDGYHTQQIAEWMRLPE